MKQILLSILALSFVAVATPSLANAYSYIDGHSVRCSYRSNLCDATIEWYLDQYSRDRRYPRRRGVGVVVVQRDNQPDKLMACNAQGYKRINWIKRGSHYTFKLYEARRCPRSTFPNRWELGRLVDSVYLGR